MSLGQHRSADRCDRRAPPASVADTHVPQSVLDDAAALLDREELGKLVYAVIEINAWNRLAITVGAPEAGSYHVPESE